MVLPGGDYHLQFKCGAANCTSDQSRLKISCWPAAEPCGPFNFRWVNNRLFEVDLPDTGGYGGYTEVLILSMRMPCFG